MRVWAFDQENHITFDGLCGWNGEENGFYKVEYFREFRQKHEAALSADELARTDKLISISEKVNEARRQYLAEKAAQTV